MVRDMIAEVERRRKYKTVTARFIRSLCNLQLEVSLVIPCLGQRLKDKDKSNQIAVIQICSSFIVLLASFLVTNLNQPLLCQKKYNILNL